MISNIGKWIKYLTWMRETIQSEKNLTKFYCFTEFSMFPLFFWNNIWWLEDRMRVRQYTLLPHVGTTSQAWAECQYLEWSQRLLLVLIRSHLEIIIKPLASTTPQSPTRSAEKWIVCSRGGVFANFQYILDIYLICSN